MSYGGRRRENKDGRRGGPNRMNFPRYVDPYFSNTSSFNTTPTTMVNVDSTVQYNSNVGGNGASRHLQQRLHSSTSQHDYAYDSYNTAQAAFLSDSVSSAKIGRAQSFLQRIFKSNDDPTFAKRKGRKDRMEASKVCIRYRWQFI